MKRIFFPLATILLLHDQYLRLFLEDKKQVNDSQPGELYC